MPACLSRTVWQELAYEPALPSHLPAVKEPPPMKVMQFSGTHYPVKVCCTSAECRALADNPGIRITEFVRQSRLMDSVTLIFEYVNPEEAARQAGLPLISVEVQV